MLALLLAALVFGNCWRLGAGQPAVGIPQATLSDWTNGLLTFYGGAPDGMDPNSPSYGTKEGSCGYGVLKKELYPYFAAAALSPSNKFYQAGPLKACGQCFEIQCVDTRPGVCVRDSSGQPASVTAMISDSCPECGTDHIDIQAQSFAKIAVPSFGRVQMRYRRVNCNPPSDMKVAVDNFGGAGAWIRLSIDDTGGRGSVQEVFVKGSSSGAWAPLTNSWGAEWEMSNAPQPPLDFKIVCDNGEAVIASSVVKQNGGIAGNVLKFPTGVQFTIAGAAGGSGGQLVQAFSGPSDDGTASSGAVPAGEAAAGCVDVAPPGSFSCDQQKSWGKCGDPALATYCNLTCGRCSAGGAGAAGSPAASPAPSSPSPQPSSQAPSPATSPTPSSSQAGPSPSPGGPPASTPPPSPSAAPASPKPTDGNLATGACTDISPDSTSCADHKAAGHCNSSITTSRNFCAASCGRCKVDGAPSSAGRKLLRHAAGVST